MLLNQIYTKFLPTLISLLLGMLLASPALAGTSSKFQNEQALAQKLINLAGNGDFMDLRAVSQAFDNPDIYNTAIFKSSEFTPNQLSYYYEPNQSKWGLTSVAHTIFLDMSKGFSQVSGSAEFDFSHCPSVQTFEKMSGGKVTKFGMPLSAHLLAGQGNTYLTYTHPTSRSRIW